MSIAEATGTEMNRGSPIKGHRQEKKFPENEQEHFLPLE